MDSCLSTYYICFYYCNLQQLAVLLFKKRRSEGNFVFLFYLLFILSIQARALSMIHLRGSITNLRADSWGERSTTSKSNLSLLINSANGSRPTIGNDLFKVGKSTYKLFYNRYCAFRIMDVYWTQLPYEVQVYLQRYCSFLPLIFLPLSTPHSLLFT